jgi:hypothetical protein
MNIGRGRIAGALALAVAIPLAGCGGGSSSGTTSAGSTAPSFDEALANLKQAGYQVSPYGPNEGAMTIAVSPGGANLKADRGASVDYNPAGEQVYATVYEIKDPKVLAAAEKAYGGSGDAEQEEGDLFFGISGSKADLATIVSDAEGG